MFTNESQKKLVKYETMFTNESQKKLLKDDTMFTNESLKKLSKDKWDKCEQHKHRIDDKHAVTTHSRNEMSFWYIEK